MALLAILQLVSRIAVEANQTVPNVLQLITGIRNAWPKSDGEPLPTDAELIAVMRAAFVKNEERRQALIDAILEGNPR